MLEQESKKSLLEEALAEIVRQEGKTLEELLEEAREEADEPMLEFLDKLTGKTSEAPGKEEP